MNTNRDKNKFVWSDSEESIGIHRQNKLDLVGEECEEHARMWDKVNGNHQMTVFDPYEYLHFHLFSPIFSFGHLFVFSTHINRDRTIKKGKERFSSKDKNENNDKETKCFEINQHSTRYLFQRDAFHTSIASISYDPSFPHFIKKLINQYG